MHGGRIEWFLDMEAYQLNGKYWPKEIAIVNRDSSICHNFHIWAPRRLKNLAKGLTAQYQYKRHNLRWEFGEWKLSDVKTLIRLTIARQPVGIKGEEKCRYFEQWGLNVHSLDELPSLKTLNIYPNEHCEIRHGTCARQKCYEILNAYNNMLL